MAERTNQTLLNAARETLHHAKLPHKYWEDAIMDAVFKYNLTMHTSTGQSPYNLWHDTTEHPPKLFLFGQIGSPYMVMHKSKRGKLGSRAFPYRTSWH